MKQFTNLVFFFLQDPLFCICPQSWTPIVTDCEFLDALFIFCNAASPQTVIFLLLFIFWYAGDNKNLTLNNRTMTLENRKLALNSWKPTLLDNEKKTLSLTLTLTTSMWLIMYQCSILNKKNVLESPKSSRILDQFEMPSWRKTFTLSKVAHSECLLSSTCQFGTRNSLAFINAVQQLKNFEHNCDIQHTILRS